ncbi:MAG: hypothetical protein Aurels2KO_57120 [Aureliella sp.]
MQLAVEMVPKASIRPMGHWEIGEIHPLGSVLVCREVDMQVHIWLEHDMEVFLGIRYSNDRLHSVCRALVVSLVRSDIVGIRLVHGSNPWLEHSELVFGWVA